MYRVVSEWVALTCIGLFFAIALLELLLTPRSRKRIRQLGGRVLAVVVRPRVDKWSRIGFIFFGFWLGLLWGNAFTEWSFDNAARTMMVTLWTSTFLVRRRGVVLRENGIVVSGIFFPWKQFVSYRWENQDPNVLLIKQSKFGFRRYRVASWQKPMLESILSEHVGGQVEETAVASAA